MKALTIKQPWAHLITIGRKTIETRTWYSSYRGPLAIHAGRSGDWMAMGFLASHRPDLVPTDDYAKGVITATADMVDCRPLATADEEAAVCECDGLQGFVLENIRRLDEPIPTRGQLGLWDVPPDVVERLLAATR